MWWMILPILLIVAGFAVPRFGAALLALAVVGAALVYAADHRADSQRAAARSRIETAELEFVDLALRPTYSGYTLGGRLRNRSSDYTLSSIRLKLIVQDCGYAAARVDVLSEELRLAHAAGNIPAAQALAREIRGLQMGIPALRSPGSSLGWMPKAPTTACETVDEYDRTIYPNVPPQQARDLSEQVYLSFSHPNNLYQWHYEVVEIVGR